MFYNQILQLHSSNKQYHKYNMKLFLAPIGILYINILKSSLNSNII